MSVRTVTSIKAGEFDSSSRSRDALCVMRDYDGHYAASQDHRLVMCDRDDDIRFGVSQDHRLVMCDA